MRRLATRILSHLPPTTEMAVRELLNAPGFALVFALSLALGLSGYQIVDSLRSAMSAHLDQRSRVMLGADLSATSDRPLSDAEVNTLRAHLPAGSRLRQETSMFFMAAHGDASRLVEVKAVDADFAFYGSIGLSQAGELGPGAGQALAAAPKVWVYPELLEPLGLRIGDTLRIGDQEFNVADIIDQDPSVNAVGGLFAPRVLISSRYLAQTALTGKGSRVSYATLAALPSSGALDSERVLADLRPLLPREIKLRSHRGASEDLQRALLYLANFLALVALVALFLGGVGSAYLFRAHLNQRLKDIAILLSLGLDGTKARLIYIWQLLFLGAAAAVFSSVLTALLLPLLPRLLTGLLPSDLALHLRLRGLLLAGAMGTLGSLLSCFPLLTRLGTLQPSMLFQEAAMPALSLSWREAPAWLPATIAYLGMAMLAAGSAKVGAWFMLIFAGATLLLTATAYLILRFLRPVGLLTRPSLPLPINLAIVSLIRHPSASLVGFLALGLSSMLLSLIPQLRAVVAAELRSEDTGGALPSLFLIDIQPEQVASLSQRLEGLDLKLLNLSPMIRARLTAINGSETPKTPTSTAVTEPETESERERNRGYNLSYRAGLSDSESLVSGRAFSAAATAEGGVAEISLEERFATRLGAHLGDRLRFDVQGVPVEGVVVNTRRVRWTAFQPNFFVQFQPGVLDEAPKTYVAAVPALNAPAKSMALRTLSREFPNVSVIDLSATIQRLLSFVAQIEQAMASMAVLGLAAGLAVLFAIARFEAERRRVEVTLLKVLGTTWGHLLTAACCEFALLGTAAAAAGTLLATGASQLLAWQLFQQKWTGDWRAAALGVVLIGLVTAGLGTLAVRRTLGQSPRRILG